MAQIIQQVGGKGQDMFTWGALLAPLAADFFSENSKSWCYRLQPYRKRDHRVNYCSYYYYFYCVDSDLEQVSHAPCLLRSG